MNCPDCGKAMRKVSVTIEDATSPVLSYQCSCGHFDFEDKSMRRAIREIKEHESLLKIRQRVVKISKNRLGMYFNKDIVRCLGLQGGEDVYVSVPEKNKILIEIE